MECVLFAVWVAPDCSYEPYITRSTPNVCLISCFVCLRWNSILADSLRKRWIDWIARGNRDHHRQFVCIWFGCGPHTHNKWRPNQKSLLPRWWCYAPPPSPLIFPTCATKFFRWKRNIDLHMRAFLFHFTSTLCVCDVVYFIMRYTQAYHTYYIHIIYTLPFTLDWCLMKYKKKNADRRGIKTRGKG